MDGLILREVQWRMSTNRRVLLVMLLLVAAIAGGCSDDAEATTPVDRLVSELDVAVSSVSTPAGWEVEILDQTADTGGFAYRASSDLSSSGTWMLISVTPFRVSEEGESPEDSFWHFVERVAAEGSAQFAQEPIATSASGLNGYSYELSGFAGEKTGQELGGYLAVFFGPEYTYEVFIQFELADRDDMSVLFRDTLAGLTLTSHDESI
jgi:hypothetical protein